MPLRPRRLSKVVLSLLTIFIILYIVLIYIHTTSRIRTRCVFGAPERMFGSEKKENTPKWALNKSNVIYADRNLNRRVFAVSCRKIFDGDVDEIKRAKEVMKRAPKRAIPDETYIHLTRNCSDFIRKRGYYMKPRSEEEANYPIAHSILLYQEAEQAERLLRAIYQPQNLYCIHVDAHSPLVLSQAMKSIAACLPNVFMASEQVPVVYASYRQLQADINCMRDLDRSPVKWKYFLNHASKAFPMKTNAELVKILKIFNGANDIGIESPDSVRNRWEDEHEIYYPVGAQRPELRSLHRPHAPAAPYSFNITKGCAQGAFSREMVRYVLRDPRAEALFEWSKATYSPEEFYWSTLNDLVNNPRLKTPGGWKGQNGIEFKPYLARLSIWNNATLCDGIMRNYACIFGVGDLQKINVEKRPELFANKFFLTQNYLALDCFEELIHNRTINPPPFYLTYYRQLPFIIKP